jgi:hypothetical protein
MKRSILYGAALIALFFGAVVAAASTNTILHLLRRGFNTTALS